MNVTDDRQTTDGRAIAYSKREREFTFAKKLTKRNQQQISTQLKLLITRNVGQCPT